MRTCVAALLWGCSVGALAQAPGIPQSTDLAESDCTFHRGLDAKGYSLWSWDLISLRRKPGYEYVAKYADGTGDKNQEITFNICGVISEVCAPYTVEQSGALPPYTRGIAIQYIDNVSPPPFTTCKDTNTCDFAVDPTCTAPTVGNVSCTANCEIVAPYIGAAPIFSLLDETKPQGGISLKYEGAPAYATDPFGSCPADPRTSLPAQRSFTINLLCPSDSTIADFSDIVLYEPTPCKYVVNATSKAACATAGDPFDKVPESAACVAAENAEKSRGGRDFAFVCLGWLLLAPVSYFMFVFADGKGWLDPIKSRLPPMPAFLSGLSGPRGGVFGSGSYKSVAPTSSSSSYGSTTGASASSYGAT